VGLKKLEIKPYSKEGLDVNKKP